MFWFVLANLLVDWLSGVFWCVFECSVVSIIVHTYLDIFENGFFICRFQKKYPSTRSIFESFSPVHMKTLKRWKYDNMPYWEMCHNDVWHRIRKPPFSSVYLNAKSQRFQNLHSGKRFWKGAFSLTDFIGYV